jgi:hypothetical protein
MKVVNALQTAGDQQVVDSVESHAAPSRDFGLVAMVWTVMGFLRVFKEAGLSTRDGAAGRHHPRPSFQPFLDQPRGERLHQPAGGGRCAGDCLVLPGAAACRNHG